MVNFTVDIRYQHKKKPPDDLDNIEEKKKAIQNHLKYLLF